jgi:hypothetical protein
VARARRAGAQRARGAPALHAPPARLAGRRRAGTTSPAELPA